MRASDRDRRGPLLAALCALLLIPGLAAAALPAAEFRVAENGTAFCATVELVQAVSYVFTEPGLLGEQVPVEVGNVRLVAENGTEVTFEDYGRAGILFPEGNYTVSFSGTIRDNELMQVFEQPYRATVTVPAGFNVTNPVLGGYSPGATVTIRADGSNVVAWESTREAHVRFYDAERESLFWFFATTWAVVAVILLFPFVADGLARRR